MQSSSSARRRLRIEQLEDRINPAPFVLPQAVTAAGINWFAQNAKNFATTSSANGFSEASFTAAHAGVTTSAGATISAKLNDAFDGVLAFGIPTSGHPGNNTYFDADGVVDLTTDGAGNKILTADPNTGSFGHPSSFNGVSISSQFFLSHNLPIVRAVWTITNPTAAPITQTYGTFNNLGSDSNTRLVDTSDGNATFENTDRWVVSFQNYSSHVSTDPRILRVREGTGTLVSPAQALNPPANGDDNPAESWTITVPAGESRYVMEFVGLYPSKAQAIAGGAIFDSNAAVAAAGLLDDLSNTELSDIVNWNINPELDVSGTNVTVSFSDATHYTVNIDGAVTAYTTTTTPSVVFTAPQNVASTVVVIDPFNPYMADASLGSADLTTPGFEFEATGAATIYVYANAGSTADLDSPPGPNYFVGVANPNYSYLSGPGLFTEVAGFGSVSAHGAGNPTFAYLYSAPHDTADGGPAGSELTDAHVTIDVDGFPRVFAIGSLDGSDAITLHSAGAHFVGTPLYSFVYDGPAAGQGTFLVGAFGFANVKALGSDLNTDSATFYSESHNVFTGSPGDALLTGANARFAQFRIEAVNDRNVVAFASADGTSTANLNSPGHSTFVGTTMFSSLVQGPFAIQVIGYKLVTATGNHDGTDIAYLYDGPLVNSLLARGSSATMVTLAGSYNVNRFGTVIGVQQHGDVDTVVELSAIDFTLETQGLWHPGA